MRMFFFILLASTALVFLHASNVVEVGMAEDDVLRALGPPQSKLISKSKRIYKWPDVEIETVDEKVTVVRILDTPKTVSVGAKETELMTVCARQCIQMHQAITFEEYDTLVTTLERAVSASSGSIGNKAFEAALLRFLRENRLARRIWREAMTKRVSIRNVIYFVAQQSDGEAYSLLARIPADLRDGVDVRPAGAGKQGYATLSKIDPVIDFVASAGFLDLFLVYQDNLADQNIPDEIKRAAKARGRSI